MPSSRLYTQILKKDYGRGGAQDFTKHGDCFIPTGNMNGIHISSSLYFNNNGLHAILSCSYQF